MKIVKGSEIIPEEGLIITTNEFNTVHYNICS
jgi:hypothetical protein